MGHVALTTVHPTWLTLQLPKEVADLLRYEEEPVRPRGPGRAVAYLARGPGIVRVVPAFQAREVLPIEIVRDRWLANAHTTDKLLHNLPQAVIQHLGVQVIARGPKPSKATDDTLLWFVPDTEYYEFRAYERMGRRWTGPGTGGIARVYLTKAALPIPADLRELEERERRIEHEEWAPRVEALARLPRGR
jgi:hypothetical protein